MSQQSMLDNMPAYFKVLVKMRKHYPHLSDHQLLMAMLALEDFYEDHILNIAEDEEKLFDFTTQEIINLEKLYV